MVIAFLSATCAMVVGAWADFTGKYEFKASYGTATLDLKQSGSSVTGKVVADEVTIDLTGTAESTNAKGTAKMSGFTDTLHWKAELAGDTLTLWISATPDYAQAEPIAFKRVGGAAIQDEKKSPLEGTVFKKQPTALLASGKEYTHASGGKFRYPATWTIREEDGFVVLIPSDAKPGETYLIVADSAEGETDPGSNQVLGFMDGEIRQSIPDARRVGSLERTTVGAGKGVIQTWSGNVNGQTILVRGYLTIVKNFGVALLAIGTKEHIDARDKDLREIFQTVGWGQGKVDPNLVGTWHYWGYKGTADGKYGREEKIRVDLRADGTFTYLNDSETTITASGANSAGEATWTGGMNARRGDGWKGTWSADGNLIILLFEDGTTETFRYRFEQQGQNTFLVTESAADGKGKMEWSRGG